MADEKDPPKNLPGWPTETHEHEPPSLAEGATQLDLSALSSSAPQTVRPGIKHATLTLDLDDSGATDEPGAAPASIEIERSAADYLGYIIDDRYHVQSIIAHGGMGVVYRCRHRTIDKAVAVKILRPDLAGDRDVTERFLVEARAASSIGNRHIIDVTDFGELPDGATYLVMEFLEGISLANRLKHPELLSVDEILDIGQQIAQGLHAAHEAGIVHRDLKPDNIFLCTEKDGRHFVKILDFGIAKVASSQNKVTRAGKIFGTPHYMAPEQGAGSAVDQRTDVYSLGVMLYELSCGQVPFDAENPLGILTQHMYMAPVPPNERPDSKRNVPVGLEAIILKCLSKDPDHRYRTMIELYDDLKLIAQGEVPRAVADLLARGSDELPLQRLRTAAVDAGARRNLPSKGTWLGLLLTASLVAVLLGVIFFPNNDAFITPAEPSRKSAPALDAENLRAQPTPLARETYTVALVLSPIDAHVFDGVQDLGTMPISIQLNKGEVATLQVKRDGFVTQKVAIDGTLTKLIVELEPIAGAELDTPVPQATPGASAAPDAGTRVVVLRHKLQPPRSNKADAGTRSAHPKHSVPPDNPQTGPAVAPPPPAPSAASVPAAPAAPPPPAAPAPSPSANP